MRNLKTYEDYLYEYSEIKKEETLHIYTDGSYSDQVSNYKISYSAVLITENENEYYLSGHMVRKYVDQLFGSQTPLNSLTAELVALNQLLYIMNSYKISNKNLLIYTDCESVYEHFNESLPVIKKKNMSKLVNNIKHNINNLKNKKNIVDIRWIPGHKQIYGNMIANYLAKKGEDINTFKIYFNMADRHFKNMKDYDWFKKL